MCIRLVHLNVTGITVALAAALAYLFTKESGGISGKVPKITYRANRCLHVRNSL